MNEKLIDDVQSFVREELNGILQDKCNQCSVKLDDLDKVFFFGCMRLNQKILNFFLVKDSLLWKWLPT